MDAVVLAGGQGIRLRPFSLTKPKPMIKLANKPILQHIIELLGSNGFRDVVITTNYLQDVIQKCFDDGGRFGVNISYPQEEYPLGTAGSVKNVERLLDDSFLVVQGDNVTDIDLEEVYRAHKRRGVLCSIALKEVDEPWRFGVVELEDDDRIKSFVEKPKKGSELSNLVNSGIYVLEPEILDHIPEDEPYDFAKDLFPRLIDAGIEISGYRAEGFWADVGSPEGYFAANEHVLDVTGGVEFSDDAYIADDVDIRPPVIVGDGARVEDGARIGPYSVIGDNSVVHEGSHVIGASIFEDSSLGRDSFVSSSIIGDNVVLKKNTRVTDSLVGDYCRFGHDCEITDNSRVWPNTSLSPFSRVRGVLRRFVQSSFDNYVVLGLDSGPMHILRTVSDKEAFYFNKCVDHDVVFTGSVAKSLFEFSGILKTVEIESLEYHVSEGINDFESWAVAVLNDPLLMSHYRTIGEKEYVGGELRKRLVEETDLRCERLEEHRMKYTVV